jgi:preprotein translocase subunit SecE
MNALTQYFKDSLKELSKVTWPTKNQAINLSLICLGFTLVSALLIGLFDLIFNQLYQLLLTLSA